jgi:hypothetical protein
MSFRDQMFVRENATVTTDRMGEKSAESFQRLGLLPRPGFSSAQAKPGVASINPIWKGKGLKDWLGPTGAVRPQLRHAVASASVSLHLPPHASPCLASSSLILSPCHIRFGVAALTTRSWATTARR